MTWSGVYYDGEQATRRQVSIALDSDILQISDENGSSLTCWPVDEVRLVAGMGNDGVIHLRYGLEGNERLNVADIGICAALEAKCPKLHHTTCRWTTTAWSIALWVTIAAVSLGLLVKILIPAMGEQFAAIIPPAWERRIGERVADQIIFALSQLEDGSSDDITCRNTVAQSALNSFVERLEVDDRELSHINLRVVDLKSANALALPGGQILVFKGLLKFAKNGDELSGVLAHEIAHVVLRHPLEIAVKGASMSILISLIVGDITGGAAITALGATLIRAAYGRRAEQDADELGIRMLNAAGLESRKMADLFERFGNQLPELGGALTYLSSHPLSRERAKHVRSLGQIGQTAFTPEIWKSIRSMCG